jgi:hypothetical protein
VGRAAAAEEEEEEEEEMEEEEEGDKRGFVLRKSHRLLCHTSQGRGGTRSRQRWWCGRGMDRGVLARAEHDFDCRAGH